MVTSLILNHVLEVGLSGGHVIVSSVILRLCFETTFSGMSSPSLMMSTVVPN
jgi:hypothetical protein